jgi:hypothetical protein
VARQDEADRGERGEKPGSVERAELTWLRRTNEILKLATGFFTQEAEMSVKTSCALTGTSRAIHYRHANPKDISRS